MYVCMYVCMYCHHIHQSMDQPGKVANPARDQLNRENEHFPVLVRALEFGIARRVRPSRPASACSLSILRLNLVEKQRNKNCFFLTGVRIFDSIYPRTGWVHGRF